MTALRLLSYTLIAYGPVAVLFLVTLLRYAEQVIVLLISAFLWLISLLLSSLVWKIVVPLQQVPEFSLPFAVIFQELFRIICYFMVVKLEAKFPNPDLRYAHKLAYASGLGYGLASGLFLFLNVLKTSLGPGVVGFVNQSHFPDFVLTSALLTCTFILLNITWSVVLFHALRKRNWILIGCVPVSHLLISGMTLLNRYISPWYSLLVAISLLFFLTLLSFKVSRGSFREVIKIVLCVKKRQPAQNIIQ